MLIARNSFHGISYNWGPFRLKLVGWNFSLEFAARLGVCSSDSYTSLTEFNIFSLVFFTGFLSRNIDCPWILFYFPEKCWLSLSPVPLLAHVTWCVRSCYREYFAWPVRAWNYGPTLDFYQFLSSFRDKIVWVELLYYVDLENFDFDLFSFYNSLSLHTTTFSFSTISTKTTHQSMAPVNPFP